MRILIDTNILIYREDNHLVPTSLSELLRLLNKQSVVVFVHPPSVEEIKKNKNEQRRDITLSKINSYPKYEEYVDPKGDKTFEQLVGISDNDHNRIDNYLLYSIYRNAFMFLITEDRDIHRKSKLLNISDRIFDIDEALDYFRGFEHDEKVPLPEEINCVPVANLEYADPILDVLKQDYQGSIVSTKFEEWWKKISLEGRKAYVFRTEKGIGALLILKEENEPISSIPPLPKNNRLKICTSIVKATGQKIGELFIKISVDTAIDKAINEIYLTHFLKENDFLVDLIEDFGFKNISPTPDGENIFLKKLIPDILVDKPFETSEINGF